MHNFYSSRSSADFKYINSPPVYDIGCKYPHYSTLRPKTEYDSIEYDYLNNKDALLERSQIYRQLHEEKLYNRRSKLIIEDLLEENKRNKTLAEEIVINKMNPKQHYKNKLSYDRQYLEDKPYRPPAQTDRKSSPNKLKQYQTQSHRNSRYGSNDRKSKPGIYTNTQNSEVGFDKKDQTKMMILKKLYQEPNKKNDRIKTGKSPQKQLLQKYAKQHKFNEIEDLKQQLRFLKDQLNQKNKDIIQLQCQVIRLSKYEKTVGQLLAKQSQRNTKFQIQPVDQSQSNQVSASDIDKLEQKKNKLDFKTKSVQVLIKSRTKNLNQIEGKLKIGNKLLISVNSQKQVAKLLSKCSSLNLSIQKPLKIFKLFEKCNKTGQSIKASTKFQQQTGMEKLMTQFQETQTTKIQYNEAQTQVQEQKKTRKLGLDSQLSIHLQSNMLGSSLQSGVQANQSQIELKLSASNIPEINSIPIINVDRLSQIKQDQSLIMASQQKIMFERWVQTENPEHTDGQSQTSENYYDYIEKTYLEWMFAKQYQEMEKNKKNKRTVQSQIL